MNFNGHGFLEKSIDSKILLCPLLKGTFLNTHYSDMGEILHPMKLEVA